MTTHPDTWRVVTDDGLEWRVPIVDLDGRWIFSYPEEAIIACQERAPGWRMELQVGDEWISIREHPGRA